MGYGGPVWHCSAAIPGVFATSSLREATVREVLDGYGDASLGEWVENRPQAFHIRRRLSEKEQLIVGDVVDMRGTSAALDRFYACKDELHPAVISLVYAELGGLV